MVCGPYADEGVGTTFGGGVDVRIGIPARYVYPSGRAGGFHAGLKSLASESFATPEGTVPREGVGGIRESLADPHAHGPDYRAYLLLFFKHSFKNIQADFTYI